MRGLALALLALTALPATAGAATVRVDPYTEPPGTPIEESCTRYAQCPPASLAFAAVDGEVNDVTVERQAAGWLVRDAGAPLAVGPGCERVDAQAARCQADAALGTLDLGDGDDRLTAPGGLAKGGPGDDILVAGSADGGSGDDVIRCIAGFSCTLDGGAGNDRLTGGRAGDELSGGSGRDVIRARGGRDRIDGGSGNDDLAGEAGSDVVTGGRGRDRLSGGSGGDRIEADERRSGDRRRAADRVHCGSGRDRAYADARDRVRRGCERLRRARRR